MRIRLKGQHHGYEVACDDVAHWIGLRRSAEDMHSICRLTHDTINEQEDME